MERQVAALFVHDENGRLVASNLRESNAPAGADPPPRFFLGLTRHGSLWRFRADLPDALVRELARLAAAERTPGDLDALPERHDVMRERLAAAAPIEQVFHGAAFRFPEVLPAPAGVAGMRFRVQRGFDPSAFYGSPALHSFDASYSLDDASELVALDVGDERLPVHWVEDELGRGFRMRAHLYVQDRRPVALPFVGGLTLAATQLVSGTRPVTLIAFRGLGSDSGAEAMRRAAREWIRSAWEEYGRMCAAP